MVGVVSNIVTAKKYGFISCDNGQEYFFHMQDVVTIWDDLVAGFSEFGGGKIKVSFTPEKTPKGPRARNVSQLDAD